MLGKPTRKRSTQCVLRIIYLGRKQGRGIVHINGRCFQSTVHPGFSQHLPTIPQRIDAFHNESRTTHATPMGVR